jgi:hypothetical protein
MPNKIEFEYSDELFEAWAELEAEPSKDRKEGDAPDPWTEPITYKARKVLIVVGWYSPVTAKGLRTAIFKKWGVKMGSILMLDLESRKLVRVTEDEKGRSVWNISKKGIEELGKDYSPRTRR